MTDWRKRIAAVPAGPEAGNNESSALPVSKTAPVTPTRRNTRFTAGVHNYSSLPVPSKGVSFFVDGNLTKSEQIALPAGATSEVVFEYTFAEPGPHLVHVSIDPDYLVLDDKRYLALDVKDAFPCLLVDGEPGETPASSETGILAFALDPTGQGLEFSVDVKTDGR